MKEISPVVEDPFADAENACAECKEAIDAVLQNIHGRSWEGGIRSAATHLQAVLEDCQHIQNTVHPNGSVETK